MDTQNNLSEVRRAALNQIEKNQKRFVGFLLGAAATEAIFLVLFLFLADFTNRLHTLLFLSSIMIYTIVGFGLFTLGAHISRCTERVIKAIENREK